MSRGFVICMLGAIVVYAAFMTWLHYQEIGLIDQLLAACLVRT